MLESSQVSEVPVEHLLFLNLQKSGRWPQWSRRVCVWGGELALSQCCSLHFVHFVIQVEKRAFLGYVQVQEIDSVILKIQWQSFITFLSLFPFFLCVVEKISQFIKLLLWKVSWVAILTPVLLCKTSSDRKVWLPKNSLSTWGQRYFVTLLQRTHIFISDSRNRQG